MSRSLALATLAAAALSACVVVPVDPRTGQPYPLHSTHPVTVAPLPPQPVTLAVRLYPLNTEASRAGLLEAQVVDHHGGRGQFSVNYLGDTLKGETTRVDAGYAAFGRVHDEVLGPSRRSYTGGVRGIANGYGSRGVNAQCEYVITGAGIGTGVCLFSDGARYQMHFGG
jgi:hypothetical protein